MTRHLPAFLCRLLLCLSLVSISRAALRLDIHPHPAYHHERAEGLFDRRDSVSGPLTPGSHSKLYFTNVSIGTPPQEVSLKISISVSDTWVWSNTTSVCQGDASACTDSSSYIANSSSTYTYLNSNFDVAYFGDISAWGDWATDAMTIGSASLSAQQFGIAYNGTLATQAFDQDASSSLLGLGFLAQESQFISDGTQYPNVPQALVNSFAINSNAYSLWLDDLDSATGSLLFGAVDTVKYAGDLMTVPIVAAQEASSGMNILLTGLGFGDSTVLKNGNVTVTLTLGSTLSYLPPSLTTPLYAAVGATYDGHSSTASIDCSQRENTTTLDFLLTWAPLSVPMSELVFSNGSNGDACTFGIATDNSSASLGLGFLRSMYVVCDLSNQEISIAPTKFNVKDSHIVDIQNGINGVPGAIRTLSASSSTHAPTSTASTTQHSTPASSSAAPQSHGLSSGAKAGIGVGVVLGVIAVSVALFFLWRWRKKQTSTPKDANYEYGELKQELPAEPVVTSYDAKRASELPAGADETHGEAKPAEVVGSEPAVHELG